MKLHELAHKYHKSIFLSTHDMELALQTADYAWLIGQRTFLPSTVRPRMSFSPVSWLIFFNREGVRFNPLSGQFTILTACTRTAHLSGDETVCALVSRALLPQWHPEYRGTRIHCSCRFHSPLRKERYHRSAQR